MGSEHWWPRGSSLPLYQAIAAIRAPIPELSYALGGRVAESGLSASSSTRFRVPLRGERP